MKSAKKLLAFALAFILAFGNVGDVVAIAAADAPDAGPPPAEEIVPTEETQPTEEVFPTEETLPEEATFSEEEVLSTEEALPTENTPSVKAPLPAAAGPAGYGIMPMAQNGSVRMTLEKLSPENDFEVGDKIAFRLEATNIRWWYPRIDDLYLAISGGTGDIKETGVTLSQGGSYTTQKNGWHITDFPKDGICVIEFTYTVTGSDVENGGTLIIAADARTGLGEAVEENKQIHVTLRKPALRLTIYPTQATYAYNGGTRTARGFDYEVAGAPAAADPKSLVDVVWTAPKTVSGTEADVYTQAVAPDEFQVTVRSESENIYKLAPDGVAVSGDLRLTITPAQITITGPRQTMTYGDAVPVIGAASVDGLNATDDGSALNVRVAAPAGELDAGDHPLAVTYTADKNYQVVSKTDGSLHVEAREITVPVHPAGTVYVGDGGQVAVELAGTPEGLLEGHTAVLTDAAGTVDTASAGEAAITQVTGALKITDGQGRDVTRNYKPVYTGTAQVKAPHTVTVTVENGTASPAGEVPVKDGESLTVTFAPAPRYALDSVTVDGRAASLTEGAYTFANVTGDHTIQVLYALDSNGDGTPDHRETHQIAVTVENGAVDPAESPITVPFGQDLTIAFTPSEHYTLGSVTVDGRAGALTDGKYTFKEVTRDGWIHVVYVLTEYNVTTHDGRTAETHPVTALTEYTPESPALRDERVFSGWATEPDGAAVYGPGEAFRVEGDTDLYAVWTAKTPHTYRGALWVSGLPQEKMQELFQTSGSAISFDLLEKKAGATEFTVKEHYDIPLWECQVVKRFNRYDLCWSFEGYKEDAYKISGHTFVNVTPIGNLEIGEYTCSTSHTPQPYSVSATGDTNLGALYYDPLPNYGLTIEFRKWTAEDSNKSVIKSFSDGKRYHKSDKYDVTELVPKAFVHEGHHYISLNVDNSTKTGSVINDTTIRFTYARDDNYDDVPDVCMATITYKVINGAWNDGTTGD